MKIILVLAKETDAPGGGDRQSLIRAGHDRRRGKFLLLHLRNLIRYELPTSVPFYPYMKASIEATALHTAVLSLDRDSACNYGRLTVYADLDIFFRGDAVDDRGPRPEIVEPLPPGQELAAGVCKGVVVRPDSKKSCRIAEDQRLTVLVNH